MTSERKTKNRCFTTKRSAEIYTKYSMPKLFVRFAEIAQIAQKFLGRYDLIGADDHFPGLLRASHFVGATHFRVGHAAHNVDDKTRSGPHLRIALVLVPLAVTSRGWGSTRITTIKHEKLKNKAYKFLLVF